MEELVKRAFADLYFNRDYLTIFHETVMNQIKGNAHLFSQEGKDYLSKDGKQIEIKLAKLPDF